MIRNQRITAEALWSLIKDCHNMRELCFQAFSADTQINEDLVLKIANANMNTSLTSLALSDCSFVTDECNSLSRTLTPSLSLAPSVPLSLPLSLSLSLPLCYVFLCPLSRLSLGLWHSLLFPPGKECRSLLLSWMVREFLGMKMVSRFLHRWRTCCIPFEVTWTHPRTSTLVNLTQCCAR